METKRSSEASTDRLTRASREHVRGREQHRAGEQGLGHRWAPEVPPLHRDQRLSRHRARVPSRAPLYPLDVPDFPVEISNSPTSLVVRLNKLPKLGSWFDLGDGTPAQAKAIRMIGGEPVIFAVKGTDADKTRLKPSRFRQRPLGGLGEISAVPPGRAGRPDAASSVAPLAPAIGAPCVLASERPAHPGDERHSTKPSYGKLGA